MSKNIFDKDLFKSCDPEKSGSAPILVEDLLEQGLRVNLATEGIVGTPPPAPFVTFNASTNEKIISNNNAFIVLGQDRPGNEETGMGGAGAMADTIDLVVGRMASSHGGKGPCDGMFVGNSFAADAARIYISRLTKVDKNFGIQRNQAEQIFEDVEEPRSAIAMKADRVRIIGREGVKIITGGAQNIKGFGRHGETNSLGGKLEYAPRIDLIAGNYSRRYQEGLLSGMREYTRIDYLQPIALGFHTRDALIDLGQILDTLMGMVAQLGTFTTSAVSGMGAAVAELAPIGAGFAPLAINYSVTPTMSLRFKKIEWDFKYISDQAPKAVWSRNVNST